MIVPARISKLISRPPRGLTLLAISVAATAAVACGGGDETSTPTQLTAPARALEATSQLNQAPVNGRRNTFVVGEGSEAAFTVNEKLARLPAPSDAVLRTGAITGDLELDGSEPLVISIDLHQLQSDQRLRDRYVRERLFPNQRMSTVTFTDLGDIPDSFFVGEVFQTNLIGTVNVNGVDADLEFQIESRLDGDTLFVLGRADFVWADFGMTAPTSRLFDVRDEVHVEVLLAAARGG